MGRSGYFLPHHDIIRITAQVRKRAPEPAQNTLEPVFGRFIEDTFHLPQRLGDHFPLPQSSFFIPYLIVEGLVSDAGNLVDFNAHADFQPRVQRHHIGPLPAVTGSVHIGDIVTDNLHHSLLGQKRVGADVKI